MKFKKSDLYSIVTATLISILAGPEIIQKTKDVIEYLAAEDYKRVINNVQQVVLAGEKMEKANPTLFNKPEGLVYDALISSIDLLLEREALDYGGVERALQVTAYLPDSQVRDQQRVKITRKSLEFAQEAQYKGPWLAASWINSDETKKALFVEIVQSALDNNHLQDAYEGITKLPPSKKQDELLESLCYKYLEIGELDMAVKRASPIKNPNVKAKPFSTAAKGYARRGNYEQAMHSLSFIAEEAIQSTIPLPNYYNGNSNTVSFIHEAKQATAKSLVDIAIENGKIHPDSMEQDLEWAYKFASVMKPSKEQDVALLNITDEYIIIKKYAQALKIVPPVQDLHAMCARINTAAKDYALERKYKDAMFALSLMDPKKKESETTKDAVISVNPAKQKTAKTLVDIAIENSKTHPGSVEQDLDWAYQFVSVMEPSPEKDASLLSLADEYIIINKLDKALKTVSSVRDLPAKYLRIDDVAKRDAQYGNYKDAMFALSLMGPDESSLEKSHEFSPEELSFMLEAKLATTHSLVEIAVNNTNEKPQLKKYHLDAGFEFVKTMEKSPRKDLSLELLIDGYKSIGDYKMTISATSALFNPDSQYDHIQDIFWTCLKKNNKEDAFDAVGTLPKKEGYRLILLATQWYVDANNTKSAKDTLSHIDNYGVKLHFTSNLVNYYIKNDQLTKAAFVAEFLEDVKTHDFYFAYLATIYRDREEEKKRQNPKYKENYKDAWDMASKIIDDEVRKKEILPSIPNPNLSSNVLKENDSHAKKWRPKDYYPIRPKATRKIRNYQIPRRVAC